MSLEVLLALCGCDHRPTRVPVSGRVLIDGRPLTYGSVRFIPSGARMAQGGLDADGRFSLTSYKNNDGTVIGLHQIVITASETIDDTTTRWHAPKKYADAATSGLTETIVGPTDALEINLTWAGGKTFDEVLSPNR